MVAKMLGQQKTPLKPLKRDAMGRRPKDADLTTYRGRFAARLRELRQRKFDTQGDFVDALNNAGLVSVTQGSVSGWERGDNAPDLETWPIVAATLGVTLRTLLPDR